MSESSEPRTFNFAGATWKSENRGVASCLKCGETLTAEDSVLFLPCEQGVLCRQCGEQLTPAGIGTAGGSR